MMLGLSKSAPQSAASSPGGTRDPRTTPKLVRSKRPRNEEDDDEEGREDNGQAVTLGSASKRAKTPPMEPTSAQQENWSDDDGADEDDEVAVEKTAKSSRDGSNYGPVSGYGSKASSAAPSKPATRDNSDSEDEVATYSPKKARSGAPSPAASKPSWAQRPSQPGSPSSLPPVPKLKRKSAETSAETSKEGSRVVSAMSTPPSVPVAVSATSSKVLATPSKATATTSKHLDRTPSQQMLHGPSPLKHSVMKRPRDEEADEDKTATPSRNVRFSKKVEEQAAPEDQSSDDEEEVEKKATRSAKKQQANNANSEQNSSDDEENDAKPTRRSSSKVATPTSKVATPTSAQQPVASASAPSPKTPTGSALPRLTPTSLRTFRPTGYATTDLLRRTNLFDSFSRNVQDKARTLYDRYISRRNQGKSHDFPSAGFVEVGCIDLACKMCGEPNERLDELLVHAQLKAGKTRETLRSVFASHRAELEKYLDTPPSAGKTRVAHRDSDSDGDGAEALSDSDLSALLNKLGVPEWREDVNAVLTAYAKGLKAGTEREKERWARGPAVVAGGLRCVAEAKGKKITSAAIIKSLPSTSLNITSKGVDKQVSLIRDDARAKKLIDKMTAVKGKGKNAAPTAPTVDASSSSESEGEEQQRRSERTPVKRNTTSLPKPLAAPSVRSDPIQARRKERLKDAEEEEEPTPAKGGVAKFSKLDAEPASAKGKEKEKEKEPEVSPRKKPKRRTLFDKMKKEKKWITGVNPMIPHTTLLDYENPRSRISRFYEAQKKAKVLLAKWDELWAKEEEEQRGDDADDEDEAEELGSEDEMVDGMDVDV